MNYFITGTDTGVGKTYCTALLLRALRREGVDAVGMKPICAGDRGDAERLLGASGGVEPINVVNPLWYRTPAAPYTAAMIEERPVDLGLIRCAYRALRQRHESVIVEGVGGWLVPITREYSLADLAAEMALPVIVVVRNRLGALNHALLTFEAIRHRGLKLAGYILNEAEECRESHGVHEPEGAIAATTNEGILTDLCGQAPLFTVRRGQCELPREGVRHLR